jgi:hypothetical protein
MVNGSCSTVCSSCSTTRPPRRYARDTPTLPRYAASCATLKTLAKQGTRLDSSRDSNAARTRRPTMNDAVRITPYTDSHAPSRRVGADLRIRRLDRDERGWECRLWLTSAPLSHFLPCSRFLAYLSANDR